MDGSLVRVGESILYHRQDIVWVLSDLGDALHTVRRLHEAEALLRRGVERLVRAVLLHFLLMAVLRPIRSGIVASYHHIISCCLRLYIR